MSLFKRGLNLITGSISQLQKSSTGEQKKKEQALERELREGTTHRAAVSKPKVEKTPVGNTESASSDEPLKPKKRTI